MHKTYKTFDYSHIPINEIEDKDLCNLAKISNLSIKELCDGKDNNLLIFPDKLDKYKDGIADSCIFTLDKQKLHTGDLLGFIGVNNSQVMISSRFAKNDNEDYFLHYMLQKVFNINLLNLKHSASDNQIFDFLAYMFPFYLKRALKQGIYKQYIKKEYNNANVRGTINVAANIRYNAPFTGKIAYKVREYAYDNHLTQLIRHTIEYIRDSYMYSVLKTDTDTEAYVSQICNVTPTFNKREQSYILNKNRTPLSHPYYTEYCKLQKLCMYILQHKRLKYGNANNKIFGLLFSGSWLWEEFLYKAVLSESGFKHPQNKIGKGGIYLFEKSNYEDNDKCSRCKRYPDYFKDGYILDAKYKHLDNNRIDRNDMHQVISYMHVEQAHIGGFLYPTTNENSPISKLGNLRGHGGSIYNIGVYIPQNVLSYKEFCEQFNAVTNKLKHKILNLQ